MDSFWLPHLSEVGGNGGELRVLPQAHRSSRTLRGLPRSSGRAETALGEEAGEADVVARGKEMWRRKSGRAV
jgi:hypothetical protein